MMENPVASDFDRLNALLVKEQEKVVKQRAEIVKLRSDNYYAQQEIQDLKKRVEALQGNAQTVAALKEIIIQLKVK
jgi:cystathionine beta-lyase/cystathionine gamma-synthase